MANFQLKTPVAFFIFKRPDTTERVFEAIRQAKPPKLFVIADGPPTDRPGEAEKCAAASAIIDRAKRNLRENFAVVGIVKEFDKTLLLLKKTFGWKNIFYKVKNKNIHRPLKSVISQATLSLIEEKNKLDIELYQYATEIFQSLVKNQDNSFEKEVKNFQNINYSSVGQFSALMSSSVSKVQKIITLN